MKLGVSSYSFSRLVRSGEMEQIAVIAKAREIGFDAIEFSTIAVPDGKTLPDYAKALRDEAGRVADGCRGVTEYAADKGVLSIEFEGIEDVLTGIQMGHDNLRRIVGMVTG